jgi:hypothetical protein
MVELVDFIPSPMFLAMEGIFGRILPTIKVGRILPKIKAGTYHTKVELWQNMRNFLFFACKCHACNTVLYNILSMAKMGCCFYTQALI